MLLFKTMWQFPIDFMRRTELLCMTRRLGLVPSRSECLPSPFQLYFLVSWENAGNFLRLSFSIVSLTTLLFVPHCNAGCIPISALLDCLFLGTCRPWLGVPYEAKALGLSGRELKESSPSNEQTLIRAKSFPRCGVWGSWSTIFDVITRCSDLAFLNVRL